VDTDTLIQPHSNGGEVRLYFTRPWVPKLSDRFLAMAVGTVIGHPVHVTAAVGGTAFLVAPGHGCLQIGIPTYELIVRGYGGLYDTIDVHVPDIKGAADAAWTYAVGPMTVRQAIRRFITGHDHPEDIDCVLAAVRVLNGGGLSVPSFRTPRGLYQWLKARIGSAS
jgi:hypothetical protein